MTLPVRNIRLRGFSNNTLNNNSGSSGEVYWDQTNNTLRVYSGQGTGGQQMARADLVNIDNTVFAAKAISAGIISSGGVNAGSIGQLAYYAASGQEVDGQGSLVWTNNSLNIAGTVVASGQKNYLRFHWDSLTDLQAVNPTTWHGMIAHVHDQGRLYFAHSGNWVAAANYEDIPQVTSFSTIHVTGQSDVVADATSDTLNLVAGTGITITTNPTTDTITITGQSTQNTFNTITIAGQANVVADSTADTLTLVAGTNISLTTNPTTDTITITGPSVPSTITQLSDVDTVTFPPAVGQVLKWNGTKWVPGIDIASGGSGTDADTLDGFDSTYYLDFTNLTSKPPVFQNINTKKHISLTGTIGSITGNGPWTATITGMTTTTGLAIGDRIDAVSGTGGLYGGTPTSVLVDSIIDSTSITYVVTGGTTPLAGDVTDIVLIGEVATDTYNDTLIIDSGNGINLTADAVNKTVTVDGTTYNLAVIDDVTGPFISLVDNNTIESNLQLLPGAGINFTTDEIQKTITIGTTGSTNSFATIEVAGQPTLSASSSTDNLILEAGTNILIQTNAATNKVIISASGGGGGGSTNSFATIAIAGQTSVVADNSTDTLTLTGGSGISLTTDAGTDTITITNSGTTFGVIAVSGQQNIVANGLASTLTISTGTGITATTNSATDTLTLTNSGVTGITAGTGISISPTGPAATGTVTITNTVSTFNSMTDVSNLSLTIDKIYLQAIVRLDVTFAFTGLAASSGYRFDSHYSLASPSLNPTIYAISGTTIAFNLNVGSPSSHPFLIQTSGGVNYNTGLIHVSTTGTVTTGASAQGKTTGTLYWRIPSTLNGNYRYQCQTHSYMQGTINIRDISII